MEQALATLHSLRKAGGTVSLEIGNLDEKICFFARTNKEHMSMVESQVYAQYPDSDVEEVESSTFLPNDEEEIFTTHLKLDAPELFPIKRHPQFDDLLNRVTIDPLSGITATLSRYAHPGMRGHISITIQPIGERYRKRSVAR